MTKDEALKLALEALELSNANHWWGSLSIEKAITAIKEALMSVPDGAQPEQKPVAWRYKWSVEGGNWVWNYATYIERQKNDQCEPLYTSPPPVAEPHKRKPLTDEELFKLWDEDMSCDMPDTFKQFKHTARAIEAAHGIKGEA